MKFKIESRLAKPVKKYLRRKGFTVQKQEVQFYDYSMDIYAFSEKNDLTVAVELKLNRWRRALEQAIIYQLCADAVFIALPSEGCRKVDRSLLLEHGVGLIGVSERGYCRQLVKPGISSVVNRVYRTEHITLLRGKKNVNAKSQDAAPIW
jgi:hypothetical protein